MLRPCHASHHHTASPCSTHSVRLSHRLRLPNEGLARCSGLRRQSHGGCCLHACRRLQTPAPSDRACRWLRKAAPCPCHPRGLHRPLRCQDTAVFLAICRKLCSACSRVSMSAISFPASSNTPPTAAAAVDAAAAAVAPPPLAPGAAGASLMTLAAGAGAAAAAACWSPRCDSASPRRRGGWRPAEHSTRQPAPASATASLPIATAGSPPPGPCQQQDAHAGRQPRACCAGALVLPSRLALLVHKVGQLLLHILQGPAGRGDGVPPCADRRGGRAAACMVIRQGPERTSGCRGWVMHCSPTQRTPLARCCPQPHLPPPPPNNTHPTRPPAAHLRVCVSAARGACWRAARPRWPRSAACSWATVRKLAGSCPRAACPPPAAGHIRCCCWAGATRMAGATWRARPGCRGRCCWPGGTPAGCSACCGAPRAGGCLRARDWAATARSESSRRQGQGGGGGSGDAGAGRQGGVGVQLARGAGGGQVAQAGGGQVA